MKGSVKMRIEKLEFNKIKVTIFPVDLVDMNINIKNLRPDSPQLHSFLSDIMEKIKEETGFNPYSARTVVEASPVGDCMVLTVTKICENKERVNKSSIKNVRAVLKNKDVKKKVYFFDKFDDMCAAISHISDESLINSICYKIENRYAVAAPMDSTKEIGIMREFSSSCDVHSHASDFLFEHGQIIAQGERLVTMASGIRGLTEH